jgi:hypothetical protein
MTETLLFPDFGVPSSVSVDGVGSDGMTTFIYFEHHHTPDSTTFIGLDLLS